MPYQMYVWNISPYVGLPEYIVVFTDGEEDARNKLREYVYNVVPESWRKETELFDTVELEMAIDGKPTWIFDNKTMDEMTQWTCKAVPYIIKTLW